MELHAYKSFFFLFLFLAAVPSVNIQSTSYSVTYGGTVTLECVVNSSPFQTSVEWQRIANGVSTNIDVTQEPRYSGGTVNSPSLIISGAVSGDAGVYVCSATNDAGKGVSGQTVLTVQGSEYRKWFWWGKNPDGLLEIYFQFLFVFLVYS